MRVPGTVLSTDRNALTKNARWNDGTGKERRKYCARHRHAEYRTPEPGTYFFSSAFGASSDTSTLYSILPSWTECDFIVESLRVNSMRDSTCNVPWSLSDIGRLSLFENTSLPSSVSSYDNVFAAADSMPKA